MYGFDVRDKVQFVGRHADELRREGRCPTGVVTPGSCEGDPYVEVELDLVEDSGEGGGSVLRLAAFNWWLTGVPIILSLRGRRQRGLARLQERRREMLARPVEFQSPILLRMLDRQIAEYSN